MNPGPGTLVGGRYELSALLGRGGMADVYRAEDRVLGRPVAVKLLRDSPDTAADRARFAAEARVLAGLAHPNLVLLLDAGTEDDRPYLVLELVEGRTWGDVLGGQAADPREVARLGVQVAAALAAAHAAGVVHRDVKPGNVLVDGSGRARLADFGIARLVGESVRHTRTGFTVGTAAYLAPEQVRGEDVTPAADVYALGLVLLEAVTGQRAYPGTSTESVFARLQRNPTIPLSLPRGWPRLLAAMTATDPAERPSAAQAADLLADLADPARLASVVPDDATTAVSIAAPRRRRVAAWPLLAGAAALVLVLALAAVAGAPGGPEAPAAADEASTVSGAASAPTTAAEPVAASSGAPTPAPVAAEAGDRAGAARQDESGRATKAPRTSTADPQGKSPGKAKSKAPSKAKTRAKSKAPSKAQGKSQGKGKSKGKSKG